MISIVWYNAMGHFSTKRGIGIGVKIWGWSRGRELRYRGWCGDVDEILVADPIDALRNSILTPGTRDVWHQIVKRATGRALV